MLKNFVLLNLCLIICLIVFRVEVMSPFVSYRYSNLPNSLDQDQASQIFMNPNWLTLGWYMYVFLKDLKRIKKHAKFTKHTKS